MAITEKAITAVLLSAFVSPLWALELQDPVAWLERMSRSAQELDYDGTFVYRSDQNQLQTLRVIHSADADQEKERLIALSGPPREVIREGSRVACFLPGETSLFFEPVGERGMLPLNFPSRLQALERFYQVAFDGGERVAGRETRKIAIRPKDRFRYGHNYWIERDSGLLLRAELLDEKERVVEEVIFTSLDVHERIPARMLKSEIIGAHPAWQELEATAGQKVDNSRWRVENTPPGFEKTVHRRKRADEKTPAVEHMVFSDGLASVSVFVEQVDEDRSPGKMRRGPLNAWMTIQDRHHVTVVGEVPAATAERFANGVRPVPEASR